MFPKKNRLVTSDFSKRPTNSFSSPLFRLVSWDVTTPQSSFAVIVPKSISKKAVVRNTIRRRVYHVLYTLKDILPHRKYAFTVRANSILNKSPEDIRSEIKNIFRI